MPLPRQYHQYHEESNLEQILKAIGLEGAPRDAATMRRLAMAIEHPAQVVESPFLGDGDPLKLSAMEIQEHFEAITNGMGNPRMTNPPTSDLDPFLPWRRLIAAISAFYEDDIHEMRRAALSIPAGTPPARLKELFEELAGKPPFKGDGNRITEKILAKNYTLVEGIGVLEEAAGYPSHLRRETARYLPEIERENHESAQRLGLWVLEVLAEGDVLTDDDANAVGTLGASDATRLCAIASLPYDPDRALIAWLRSLNLRLLEGGTTPAESLARLSVAAEIFQIAKTEGLSSHELISSADAILDASFPMLKSLLPSIVRRTDESVSLEEWLDSSSRSSNSVMKNGIRSRRSRKQALMSGEPTLFDEVSS